MGTFADPDNSTVLRARRLYLNDDPHLIGEAVWVLADALGAASASLTDATGDDLSSTGAHSVRLALDSAEGAVEVLVDRLELSAQSKR